MGDTQTVTIAPAGTWELDAVHSAVGFEVEYLGGTFKGSFREIDATLVVGEDAVSLEGSAQVASVDVKDENLAGHLQSPDFFDAERYPEIRFTAKNVSRDGETVKVEGDLTIKGVTRPVELELEPTGVATDPFGNVRAGFEGEAQLSRKDFGLTWNVALEAGGVLVSDKVKIQLDVSAIKQA